MSVKEHQFKMDDFDDFEDIKRYYLGNWTTDYLDNLDTSKYPFPNTLWHLKAASEIALKTSLTLALGIFGLFTNFIIIFVLLKNRWLWSSSNFLLFNLAFADFLSLLLCPWFMLVRDFYQNYVLRKFGCFFEGFMQATILMATVGAIVLVSYDRLASAALTPDAKVTRSAAIKLVIFTWIAAVALGSPWIFKRSYYERQWLDYLEMYCVEDIEFLGVYWHLTISLLVWIPLGVLFVTYSAIIWRLEMSSRKLQLRDCGHSVVMARNRVMRISACILVCAAICRVPYTILVVWRENLANEINSVEGRYSTMWFLANYMMYLNSAINPLIYGFTNTRFKRAMDKTPGISWLKFGSWCCVCSMFQKKQSDLNTDKIFVVEDTPIPNKNFVQVLKNLLHINKHTIELSTPKEDEATTRPTKVTPLNPDIL